MEEQGNFPVPTAGRVITTISPTILSRLNSIVAERKGDVSQLEEVIEILKNDSDLERVLTVLSRHSMLY